MPPRDRSREALEAELKALRERFFQLRYCNDPRCSLCAGCLQAVFGDDRPTRWPRLPKKLR